MKNNLRWCEVLIGLTFMAQVAFCEKRNLGGWQKSLDKRSFMSYVVCKASGQGLLLVKKNQRSEL
jgi:hypothetical protein